MNNTIKILDCTFRDGGYYNAWDFDYDLTHRYLLAIKKTNIDLVELGFRQLPQSSFLGAFAYTTDQYINTLTIHPSIMIGVMIDASHILNSNYGVKKTLDILFKKKSQSRVDFVRVATHFDTIEACYDIVEHLSKLGYKIGLNLMQSNGKSKEILTKTAKLVNSWQLIDVLYFADSLGNMNNEDVIQTINALKKGWKGELGIHAHNNKGLAVSNSLIAVDHGVSWVDGTVLGMGRGAGNAQMENLLLELSNKTNYKADNLFDLVLSDFTTLQKQYCWGESLLYNLAAINNIHPTYIQELLADNRYSNKEAIQIINFMSSLDASHYNKNLLLQARGNINNPGSWNATNWCLKKEVLILGSGQSLQTYQQGIIQYIKTYNPIVISLNIKQNFPTDCIDIYVSSNESKMLVEFEMYIKLDKPLITSKVLLEKVIDKSANIKQLWDYGLNIKQNTLNIDKTECTLPYELSIGYALSLANIGGANSINLVGFDGYDIDDTRHTRVSELLNLYNAQSFMPIVTLTPTTYLIKQSSIYAQKI